MTAPAVDLPRSARRQLLPLIALIAFATIISYVPAVRDGWVWDDNHYVTHNIDLCTLHGLAQIWLRPGATPQYYPLTHTTFWIEYHLWGIHPLGYHLDNVLLQIANAALVAVILRRLKVPGYGLAALLFALHPVHVESVAWVTERKNLLSGLFYLLSILIALDVWRIDEDFTENSATMQIWGRRYALCLTLFVAALLSKSVTASLPAVVLLLIWWKRGRLRWKEVVSLVPFFALGAIMGSVTGWMEKHIVGASGAEWRWSFSQRVLIAGRAIWFYLGKLVWPHPLMFIYPKWNIDSADGEQWICPVAVLVVVGLLFVLRRRIGRWPLVAALFFIVSLFPALGFLDVYPMRYSFVADHFQYLASIAPLAVAAAALSRAPRVAVVPILIVLGVLTWRQGDVYLNSESLWRDVVSKNPNSAVGHCDLGDALMDRGDLNEAADQFQQAMNIDPQFVEAEMGLGAAAEARGEFSQAADIYRQARDAHAESPLPVWQLGLLDRRHNDPESARQEFAAAAERLPNPSPAYEELGEIALSEEDLGDAEREFRRALDFDADRFEAYDNLAAIALRRGDFEQAETDCRAALRIKPDDGTAKFNLNMAVRLLHQ
ncbi:MAG: tetratricopeptide repeat protein [Tepidisphaeraceae bacterium]|jgi:tetratricopeptide (TPR) repeat protein